MEDKKRFAIIIVDLKDAEVETIRTDEYVMAYLNAGKDHIKFKTCCAYEKVLGIESTEEEHK